MADLFESLLPAATWERGKPGMGEIVSEGSRKIYEHLVRPMASPGGMAMGAAFGAAPKALAAVGGAALGGLGVAQGVKEAEEGAGGIDAAIPIIMGGLGIVGLAAMKGRIAKGLIRGKAGAISEEMLALADEVAQPEQLKLPFAEKFRDPFLHTGPKPALPEQKPPKGRPASLGQPFRTDEEQRSFLLAADPLWRQRSMGMIDSAANEEGVVTAAALRAVMQRPKETKATLASRGLQAELDNFGVRAALLDYMNSNKGRERFSTQELKAVASIEGGLGDSIYQDMIMPREPAVPRLPGDLSKSTEHPRWTVSTMVHTMASPPAQFPDKHFDLFVTFNQKLADKMGWATWKDGHAFYDNTLSGVPIDNPIVRMRMGHYKDVEGRNVLMVLEIQAPFKAGSNKLAQNYPKFFEDNNRWMKMGIRRAIRHAAENNYDYIAWPSSRMIDATQGFDFPMFSQHGQRSGIRWTRTQDGNFMIRSNATRDIGKLGDDAIVYTPEALEQTFGRQVADRIKAASDLEGGQGQTAGFVDDIDFPLRPLAWSKKVYEDKLSNTVRDEVRAWRHPAVAKDEEVLESLQIDFPDDRHQIAEGNYEPPYDVNYTGAMTGQRGQYWRPERNLKVNRWFPEVSIGVQPVHAVRVGPWAHRAAKKGSYMTALVPPAIGLGLAASQTQEEQK